MLLRIEASETELACCAGPLSVGEQWTGMVVLGPRWERVIDPAELEGGFDEDGRQVLPPVPSADLSQRVRVTGTVRAVGDHHSVAIAVGSHALAAYVDAPTAVGDEVTVEGFLTLDPHSVGLPWIEDDPPFHLSGVVQRVQVTELADDAGRSVLEWSYAPLDDDDDDDDETVADVEDQREEGDGDGFSGGWFMATPMRWSDRDPSLRLPPYDVITTDHLADEDGPDEVAGAEGYVFDLDVDVPAGAIVMLDN
jgi:hypothetical protein